MPAVESKIADSTTDYDVIVAGGGLAGVFAAVEAPALQRYFRIQGIPGNPSV